MGSLLTGSFTKQNSSIRSVELLSRPEISLVIYGLLHLLSSVLGTLVPRGKYIVSKQLLYPPVTKMTEFLIILN